MADRCWLNTLKRLVREYGPTTNTKSTKLEFLRSNFCKELQRTDFTEYFKNAEILLHSSTTYKHAQNPVERKWQQLKYVMHLISYENTFRHDLELNFAA